MFYIGTALVEPLFTFLTFSNHVIAVFGRDIDYYIKSDYIVTP